MGPTEYLKPLLTKVKASKHTLILCKSPYKTKKITDIIVTTRITFCFGQKSHYTFF